MPKFLTALFWKSIPKLWRVKVKCMTNAEVSHLLYCIGQESALAYQKMPLLCAFCKIAYPPQFDITQSGLSSVPTNAAPSMKDI
jgi:hypothetical protein